MFLSLPTLLDLRQVIGRFEKHTPPFAERGWAINAISTDGDERTLCMAEKVGGSALRYGYDLSLEQAPEWSLFISTSRGKTSSEINEPAMFSNPGLVMVSAVQTLFYAQVQTMPVGRAHFAELVVALDFVIANDYPARGEYTGAI